MTVRMNGTIGGWPISYSDSEFMNKVRSGELPPPDFIFMFDTTGYAAKPFSERGATTLICDLTNVGNFAYNAHATYCADWDVIAMEDALVELAAMAKFVFGFPPCTDLAVSGARHFESKWEENNNFQVEAVYLARSVERVGVRSGVAWSAENPTSVLSTMWRKPDYTFSPFEFGGYLPEEDVHPDYPKYIAPRDAYPKTTNLWQGNGFRNPWRKPVYCPPGPSLQYLKLGGKSALTKRVRSATPRGYFIALAETYCK